MCTPISHACIHKQEAYVYFPISGPGQAASIRVHALFSACATPQVPSCS